MIQKLFNFVLLAPIFFSLNSYAQDRCQNLLNSKLIKIHNPTLERNGFHISRGIGLYHTMFEFYKSKSLADEIMTLPAGSNWIDMGAGKGIAMAEALEKNKNINQAIAISYLKPNDAIDVSFFENRMSYLSGDYVENIYMKGQLNHFKKKLILLVMSMDP